MTPSRTRRIRGPISKAASSNFGQPAYSRADYGYRGDWAIESVKLVLPRELAEKPADELRRMIRERPQRVQEMIVHLRAVKPPRPARLDLLQWPVPENRSSAGSTGNGGFWVARARRRRASRSI